MRIDWERTDKAVLERLASERIPWHYKQLYYSCAKHISGSYATSTDPIEKLRQHYSENEKSPFKFLAGGFVALERWFNLTTQISMFPPEPVIKIKGNCLISYEIGYEQAIRQQHMFDHFGNGETTTRYKRRKIASLVEGHIKDYFQTAYPKYYSPPSNDGEYHKGAPEDFFLEIPLLGNRRMDVKSWSYTKKSRQVAVARNIKDDTIYMLADWNDDDSVSMHGILSGKRFKDLGQHNPKSELTHIEDNFIISAEVLIVRLNMHRADMMDLLKNAHS